MLFGHVFLHFIHIKAYDRVRYMISLVKYMCVCGSGLLLISTPCRSYLYCGRCKYIYSIHSTHRNVHRLYCVTIMVCFACGKFGPTRIMGPQCGRHIQPQTVASRHEMNESLTPLLQEFQLRGQSMSCVIINYFVSHTI